MSANDEGNEEKMKAFFFELACELIGVTPQKRGAQMVHPGMDEDE